MIDTYKHRISTTTAATATTAMNNFGKGGKGGSTMMMDAVMKLAKFAPGLNKNIHVKDVVNMIRCTLVQGRWS